MADDARPAGGRPPLDHLWAGWRATYLERAVSGDAALERDAAGTLFERILTLDDESGRIVARGPRCSVLLNAYPYANGHLLVVPNRAVAELHELDDGEHAELWAMVRDAVAALRGGLGCEGINVGCNLGRAAGAGVPDHLHVHCVPRWAGDTNFMTAVADARVLPQPLAATWRLLREAWPSAVAP